MDKTYHVPFSSKQIEAAIGKSPIIQTIGEDSYWFIWDVVKMEYVNTDVPALIGDLAEMQTLANRADAAARRAIESAVEAKKWADQAAEQGGQGGGGTAGLNELDDYSMEIGQFTNAGAGWCSQAFREPFDAPPRVILQAESFSGWVEVRNITKDGFQYCLRQPGLTEATPGSVSTGSFYTAAGPAADSTHSAQTLVTKVTMPVLPAISNQTTAKQVVVNYIAIEYGGER